MRPRIIAIGDIHGCSVALSALIKVLAVKPNDTIVTLGDYVDRGPDSKGVLNQLIELGQYCRHVPILGNHDQMMLDARYDPGQREYWLRCGGRIALDSYCDGGTLDDVPADHFRFLEQCAAYFETDTHFFVHANYDASVPLDCQSEHELRWLSLREFIPPAHESGKIAVVGHTPQPDVLDLGYLIGIDTGCWKEGWLTALDVHTCQNWQVDKYGVLR